MSIDDKFLTKITDQSLCSYKKSPLKLLVSTRIGGPPSKKSVNKKRKVIEADKGIFERLLSEAQSMFDDDEDHSQLEITVQEELEIWEPQISDISMMDFSKEYRLVSALRSIENRTEGSNRIPKRKVTFCENLIQESSNINYNDCRSLLKINKELFKIDNAVQPIYGDDGEAADQSFSDFFNHLDQDKNNSYVSETLVNLKVPDATNYTGAAITYSQHDDSEGTCHLENSHNNKVFHDIEQLKRIGILADITHHGNHLESTIVPFPIFISPTLAPPIPFRESPAHTEEIVGVKTLKKVDEIIEKFTLFIVNINKGRILSNDSVNQFLDTKDLMVRRDIFGDSKQNENMQTLENAVTMKVSLTLLEFERPTHNTHPHLTPHIYTFVRLSIYLCICLHKCVWAYAYVYM